MDSHPREIFTSPLSTRRDPVVAACRENIRAVVRQVGYPPLDQQDRICPEPDRIYQRQRNPLLTFAEDDDVRLDNSSEASFEVRHSINECTQVADRFGGGRGGLILRLLEGVFPISLRRDQRDLSDHSVAGVMLQAQFAVRERCSGSEFAKQHQGWTKTIAPRLSANCHYP